MKGKTKYKVSPLFWRKFKKKREMEQFVSVQFSGTTFCSWAPVSDVAEYNNIDDGSYYPKN